MKPTDKFLTWTIGKVRITCIVELGGRATPGTFLFAPATPDYVRRHEWLVPHFATEDGLLLAAVQAFVVESEGRKIIVDTCVGNDKHRSVPMFNQLHGTFLEDLAEAGFPPETIDTVLCTHLHVDHVGWNTHFVGGEWVPTFPNARYLFGRCEWDHWSGEAAKHNDGDVIGDSVRPIVERGLCDLVEMDHRLTGDVRLAPTPGHTPGHVSVHIKSEGKHAIITGDVMHHPIQCGAPDLANNFDVNADAARRTRREFLNTYADKEILIIGTHFAAPTAGWLASHGDHWRFLTDGPAGQGPT